MSALHRQAYLLEADVVHLQVDCVLEFIQQGCYVILTVHCIPATQGQWRRDQRWVSRGRGEAVPLTAGAHCAHMLMH